MTAAKFIAAAFVMAAGTAGAQSGVTISGVLDAGYQHNTNSVANGTNRMETRHEPSYLRFSGSEDLGNGLEARFALDMSIQVPTGTAAGFNRESSVGIGSKSWGSLTFGRQYDTMVELVGVDPPRFNSVTAVHVGNWDRTAGNYLNNMVKYRTPAIGGVTGTVIYSRGDDAATTTNRSDSYGAAATYLDGPLRLSGAWLRINGLNHRPFNDVGRTNLFGATFATTAASVVTNDTMLGLGAYYDFPAWRVLGNITRTKLEAPNGTSETYRSASAGVVRNPNTVGFRPGVGVSAVSLADSRFTTVYGILDYYFTRRTDVYFRVVSQKARGPAGQRAAVYLEGPTTGDHQLIYGIGLTHRF